MALTKGRADRPALDREGFVLVKHAADPLSPDYRAAIIALVYDTLELHKLASPIYPTGETDSKIGVVICSQTYVDCGPILQRLPPDHSVDIAQFPGGDWPAFKEYRDY